LCCAKRRRLYVRYLSDREHSWLRKVKISYIMLNSLFTTASDADRVPRLSFILSSFISEVKLYLTIQPNATFVEITSHQNDASFSILYTTTNNLKNLLHNCRTYLKIHFFLSPCRSDNTEHFCGSLKQFIFFNCQWYMHGTVAVHTCDTGIQHWLKASFLAAFTILLCGDCLATLVFRPSTGNHYITPAAIQKYIENGITTREPPSSKSLYYKIHFTHYIDFSYNNFVQKIY